MSDYRSSDFTYQSSIYYHEKAYEKGFTTLIRDVEEYEKEKYYKWLLSELMKPYKPPHRSLYLPLNEISHNNSKSKFFKT